MDWPTGDQLLFLFNFRWVCLAVQGSPTVKEHVISVESLSLIFHGTSQDLFVLRPRFFSVILGRFSGFDSFAALFNCTPVDRASGLYDSPDLKLFILVGLDRSFRLLIGPPGIN